MTNIKIVEVGPRDGLQNESRLIDLELKKDFIKNLSLAGLKHIEVASFVNPKAIPQMSNAIDLVKSIDQLEYQPIVLIPNLRGAEFAKDLKCSEVSVFTTNSESFASKNVKSTIKGTIQRVKEIRSHLGEGVKLRGYISTVFGCPYEGATSEKIVIDLINELLEIGCYEIALGDTIGVASPSQVRKILKLIDSEVGLSQIGMHFHDTFGLASANVYASLEAGVRTFDSSAGGLGGCPYALGATGNLATEDLVHLLEKEGFETNIDMEKLYQASQKIFQFLNKTSNSKVNQVMAKRV